MMREVQRPFATKRTSRKGERFQKSPGPLEVPGCSDLRRVRRIFLPGASREGWSRVWFGGERQAQDAEGMNRGVSIAGKSDKEQVNKGSSKRKGVGGAEKFLRVFHHPSLGVSSIKESVPTLLL